MFKKVFSPALAAVMALSLVACGGSSNEEPAFSADLTAFYETIFTDPENTPAMMDLAADKELLEMSYPGLADIETKQLVAYTPMMMQVAADIVMVEVANSADVEKVQTIFQTRIDSQIEGGAWYPATVEVWENAQVVTVGSYVCLFALDGAADVAASFQALGGSK